MKENIDSGMFSVILNISWQLVHHQSLLFHLKSELSEIADRD